MAQPQQGYNPNAEHRRWGSKVTGGGKDGKYVAIVVLTALALLIAIRLGFRGVNVLGVSASVK